MDNQPVEPTPLPKSAPSRFPLVTLILIVFIFAGGIVLGNYLAKNQPEQKTREEQILPSPTEENEQTSNEPESTPASTQNPQGKVEGKICYPSHGVPPGNILAKNVETGEIVKTYFEGVPPENQAYTLELDVGRYVFAYDPGEDGTFMGFYTPCAPTMHIDDCSTDESHQLIEVNVTSEEVASGIDLCDYYYEPDQKPDF